MKKLLQISVLALLAFGLVACGGSPGRTSGGGVLIVVSDFDGLPLVVGVDDTVISGTNLVQAESFTIQSIVKNPTGDSGELMNVQLQSYRVTYRRVDAGTRTPPVYESAILGLLPVGGTLDIDNLPILATAQLSNPPLTDLILANGGVDSETGDSTIILELSVQFFGATLSGERVETAPVGWTIEFRPSLL